MNPDFPIPTLAFPSTPAPMLFSGIAAYSDPISCLHFQQNLYKKRGLVWVGDKEVRRAEAWAKVGVVQPERHQKLPLAMAPLRSSMLPPYLSSWLGFSWPFCGAVWMLISSPFPVLIPGFIRLLMAHKALWRDCSYSSHHLGALDFRLIHLLESAQCARIWQDQPFVKHMVHHTLMNSSHIMTTFYKVPFKSWISFCGRLPVMS